LKIPLIGSLTNIRHASPNTIPKPPIVFKVFLHPKALIIITLRLQSPAPIYVPAAAIEFAVAASSLKHTIKGDVNLATIEEVEKLMSGDGSGRVSR